MIHKKIYDIFHWPSIILFLFHQKVIESEQRKT